MSGVGPGGTGNTKRDNPNLEKMDQYVDIKVQIIFSSISYTKFLRQKNKSTKFITNKKGGSVSDYYLYCAEDWPEKTYNYNDPVDQVIFIDCGSDDFGTATANAKNEQVLRKYTSFAIMRLKDMLYRRSQIYGQTGQVHCMILAISPFQKCMMAISALLGKMLADSGIYFSFIADVGSRPEYRYTFNWIRSYGWRFEVYYNAVFRPFYARVECKNSPLLKLNEIDKLVNAETRYKTNWGIFDRSGIRNSMWGKNYDKDKETGDVILPWGEKAKGSKQEVVFFDKTEKKTTTYDGEEVTLTEFVSQEKATEVWVPADPKVDKWKDPVSGKLLVRYNGQIYERDYLQDFYEQNAHPNDDTLTNRIGETHKAYDEALQREKETKARVAAARAERDSNYTNKYIQEEVDNLVSKTGMSPEDAKKALAEQGFIPQDTKGNAMYFHDGRMMSDEQLNDLEKAAAEATEKAKKDYEDAIKAKEIKDRNDYLFWLNMASLVVGVLSFGATTLAMAAAFAVLDLAINVGVVYNQIQLATTQGGEWHDAFGDNWIEKGINMGLTGLAVIGDCLAFVPVFKAIKTPKALPHANVSTSVTAPAPKPKSGRSEWVVNARGEKELHTTITNSDGSTNVIKRNAAGETITSEHPVYNGDVIQNTVTPDGFERQYKNGLLQKETDPKTGTKKEIMRNSDTGEIEGINYYELKMGDELGNAKSGHWQRTKVENYKNGKQTGVNGKPVKDGARIDKNGVKIDGDGVKGKSGELSSSPNEAGNKPNSTGEGSGQPAEKTQGGAGEGKGGGTSETKGQGGSGESNAANAENADTPMKQADDSALEVAEDGNGIVSSNTGNGETLVQKMKQLWAEANADYTKGMNYQPGDSLLKKFGKAFKENMGINLLGKNIKEWDKWDFISAGSIGIHWICAFVALKNAVESIADLSYEPEDNDISESFADQTVLDDGGDEVHTSTGEIDSLVGVDAKSLDAKAIADDSKETMNSLEEFGYGKDDELYQDYSQMNTAANNVIEAKNKVEAAKYLNRVSQAMTDRSNEIGFENAVTDETYSNLSRDYYNLAEQFEDPNSDYYTVNPNTIVVQTEAELEGAQVDLLLQQAIQKNKDDKLTEQNENEG